MYYESLDKHHNIVRFRAKSDAAAIENVKVNHYCSLIRISKNFVMLKTVLKYDQNGY